MFVVLGACFLALALMGTLLLREPTPEEAEGILQMGEHDGQEQKVGSVLFNALSHTIYDAPRTIPDG